jgi:hypothetical protein
MPAGWVHATFDLAIWGRSYFDHHRQKGRWSKTLGRWHRRRDHDWYWKLGSLWTLESPFPSCVEDQLRPLSPHEGEKLQVDLSHDYLDRTWDFLTQQERDYWEGFFAWLLLHPRLLMTWAGVDVLSGRIARQISGKTLWRRCPAVRGEYQRLRKYLDVVIRKKPQLRLRLNLWGQL